MDIINLLHTIFAINKKYENITDLTGENFNIFRILKIESNEVRTHSAFLAELLNPKGKHGQKDSFLKAFIKYFNIEGFENLDKIEAVVEVEKRGENGRIDILIKPTRGKKIVIENKIYAIDQVNQLIRYKEDYPSCHLLYLTLGGKEPDKLSIHDEWIGKSLENGSDYFTISYKEDILNWLLICRKEATNYPILRETINQYINLIKHLTHQTMNEQNKFEIIETILKNPESIESAQRIAESWVDVEFKILEKVKTKIFVDSYIRHNLNLLIEFDEKYRLGEERSNFSFYKSDWKYCVNFYFGADFEKLVVGIAPINESLPEDLNFAKILNNKLALIGESANYPGWTWVIEYEFWNNTEWKYIEDRFPIAIRETLENLIKNLEGLNI